MLWAVLVWFSATLVMPAQQPAGGSYPQKVRTFHTAEEFARLTARKVEIDRRIDPAQEAALHKANVQLPHPQVTVLKVSPAGEIWIGTSSGAVRLARDYGSREYFGGRRWLPDDHVTGIGFDNDSIWLETRTGGYARIRYAPMTLAEKSRAFVDSRAGAPQPLGAHGRFAPPGSRRPLDEPDGVERQRRTVDRDVRRGENHSVTRSPANRMHARTPGRA